jgi:hypothetical protein
VRFDNIIGFVIFIVIIVLSIAQKAMEQSKAKRRLGQAKREGGGTPRRGAAVQDIPMAQPRAGRGRPAKGGESAPQIEDVIRRFVGQATGQASEGPSEQGGERDEEKWQPLPPPIRGQAPTQYQKPAPRQAAPPPRPAPQPTPPRQPRAVQPPRPPVPPLRQRPAATPAKTEVQRREIDANEDVLPIEIEQRENERRWREEMEQRKKLQKKQTPQRQPEVLHSRAGRLPGRRRLFHTVGDVRRAIILSEVLGPPRAMRNFEERG